MKQPTYSDLLAFAVSIAKLLVEGEAVTNRGGSAVSAYLPAGSDGEVDELYRLIKSARFLTGAEPDGLVPEGTEDTHGPLGSYAEAVNFVQAD